MTEVYLIDGARTAFTAFGGSFSQTSATKLGTHTAIEAMKRANVAPTLIDHVIYGNVIHSEKSASYLSRHIALHSGVPIETPALNVNRLCGSGLQAVVSAAQHILLGEAEVVLAGGAENMSQAPFANFEQRFHAPKLGGLTYVDMLQETLTDQYTGCGMGLTAEALAQKYEITREEQDAYSVLSNERATRAKELFQEEIVPVAIQTRKGSVTIQEDEHVKPTANVEALARIKPAFKKDGTVTAGNASGINDGAVSLVVAGTRALEEHQLKPLAKIVSWAVVGVDPSIMGIGPVTAIQLALKKANLSLEDIDLFEINEAFAAQYLAVEKALGLDRSKTNVNGGAIALGHPVGASGARVLLTAVYELKRRRGKYAVVSLCIGGGQGIAMVIEHV